MMRRIFTIILFLGFTGGFGLAQAEQKTLSLECQYSCSCQACCAANGINCNPTQEKTYSPEVQPTSVEQSSDVYKATN